MELFLVFILGLAAGSFLNVVIFRLRGKKNFFLGRSRCLACGEKISWYDNIPLFSFILLQGKCRHCKKNISWQYPAVELAAAALFTMAFIINFQFSIFNFQTISNGQFPIIEFFYWARDVIFISILIIIFVYDVRWYLILDSIAVPAVILAFVINVFLGFDAFNLLLAGLIAGGFFLMQFVVSNGRWIGGGDIRLGVLMGAMLGFPQVLAALFLAYIFGSIVGVGLLMAGRKQLSSKLPFGAFLTAATLVSLFWGHEILAWYLNFL